MENTVEAQRMQILSDWRNHLSLDEFRLLVVQIDSLIELAREEGGLTQRTLDSAPPYTTEELDIITDPRRNGALRNPPSQ